MRGDTTQDRDELDILLDAALATYVSPEPSPSLTARILAATRAIDRHPPVRWMVWAMPALATALLMTILLTHRPTARRERSQPTADLSAGRVPASAGRAPTTPGKTIAADTTPHLGSTPPRATRSVRTTASLHPLPRQEVFPTPTPLSPEEQALAALAQSGSRDSKELAQQMTQPASQPQPIEPLRVAAIHIPPLNPPDNGDN